MNLSDVRDASLGAPQVLVLGWPEEDRGPPIVEAFAVCLMKRSGGLLLAVPVLFFDEELLASAQLVEGYFLHSFYCQLLVHRDITLN